MTKILYFILSFFALYSIVIILTFLANIIKTIYSKNRKINISQNKLIFTGDYVYIKIIIFLVGLFHIIMSLFFTNTQIGDFYEKHEYTEKYYINFSYNRNDIEFYKLTADIFSSVDTYEDLTEGTYTSRNYYITKIYFPDGNTLTFDYEKIIPQKQTSIADIDGNRYYVELTKDKVNN